MILNHIKVYYSYNKFYLLINNIMTKFKSYKNKRTYKENVRITGWFYIWMTWKLLSKTRISVWWNHFQKKWPQFEQLFKVLLIDWKTVEIYERNIWKYEDSQYEKPFIPSPVMYPDLSISEDMEEDIYSRNQGTTIVLLICVVILLIFILSIVVFYTQNLW